MVQVNSLRDAATPMPRSLAGFLALPLLAEAARLDGGEPVSQEGFTLLNTLSNRLSLSQEVPPPPIL